MKVCCSSRSYARALAAGDLTQLEWVDLCANELMLDGVEFMRSHFPRLDTDYVAQLKKLCVDRWLTVASLHHDTPFEASDIDQHVAKLTNSLEVAAGLGAPIVRLRAGAPEGSPLLAWRELIRGLSAACIQAKQYNITFALEPHPDSLVSSPSDVKRAMKECDSAWLRLALSATMLGTWSRDEWSEALNSSAIVIAPMTQLDTFGADEGIDYLAVLTLLWQRRYRGFLSLEYLGREDEKDAVARAVAWLRGILAKDALKAAATES
ncbi:MAG TPA: sugar phosphate isomerase/epimerase family protein [Candidatus Eremiobacteraceae bacterium]|nr:sugar phosphate isomerase/epimerase family protein [Candidatus Eremiobacteraceae bacterium]